MKHHHLFISNFNPDYALGEKKIRKASAPAHAPYLCPYRQDIDVQSLPHPAHAPYLRPCRHSEFSKSVATLLVVSLFENLLGALRACEDFRDSNA